MYMIHTSVYMYIYIYTHIHSTRRGTGKLITTLQHTATHCNTLQHTATHCNKLLHAATHAAGRSASRVTGYINCASKRSQCQSIGARSCAVADTGRIPACCSMLQYVAVCCSMLQYVVNKAVPKHWSEVLCCRRHR